MIDKKLRDLIYSVPKISPDGQAMPLKSLPNEMKVNPNFTSDKSKDKGDKGDKKDEK